MMKNNTMQMIYKQFNEHGGTLRVSEAIGLGIEPRTLYALRDRGELVQITRGIYRLAVLPTLSHPDFVIIAKRIPRAVICLISALSFHDLTTQIPHEVTIALPKSMQRPRLNYPPIRSFWFSPESYANGVETHEMDGTTVRIYSSAKTITDCFKFRNKIGFDVALEGLKRYMVADPNINQLLNYARQNRVATLMTPYIEAMI